MAVALRGRDCRASLAMTKTRRARNDGLAYLTGYRNIPVGTREGLW